MHADDRKDTCQERIAAVISRRGEQSLTAQPRCLMDRALHDSAEYAASSTQPYTCTCHEPRQCTMDLRQVSHASSGTSSLTADLAVLPSAWALHCANLLRTHVRAVIRNGARKARPGQANVLYS